MTQVDWDAAAAALGTVDALGATTADRPAVTPDLFARLNRATGERFAGIGSSPVPVLLPFDTAAFLRDRAAAQAAAADAAPPLPATSNYLSGFNAVPFFYPGPAGYDAVVVARAQDMRELGIGYYEPIYIHISGSALIYELAAPTGVIGWPVSGDLETEFPGIQRLFLENYVRYTFVRYGVPYAVAIECFDGGVRFCKIS